MTATLRTAEGARIDDSKLRVIANDVVNTIELAIEKAIANAEEPNNYPMPQSATALEQKLKANFTQLPARRQRQLAREIMPRVKASAATRRQAHGRLADVNLRLAKPVAEQALALPVPPELRLTASDVQRIAPRAAAAAQSNVSRLELRLHKIECLEKTREFLEGKDEMSIVGTRIDATDTKNTTFKIDLGKFKEGEVRALASPVLLSSFNLRDGDIFPKTFAAALTLTEVDRGTFPQALDTILGAARDLVIKFISGSLEDVGGDSSGGNNGLITLAIIALPFVLEQGLALIKTWYEDEIFNEQTVLVTIPALDGLFPSGKTDSPDDSVTFTRPEGKRGRYRLTYDWRLV